MQFLRSRLRLGVVLPLTAKCENWEQNAKAWLDKGASSLFLRPLLGVPLEKELRAQVQSVVAHATAQKKYVFVCDDALLTLEADAHGLFCSVQPRSVERLREVIGLRKFLGVSLWDVPTIHTGAVDFVAVESAAAAKRLRPLPTFLMHPSASDLHSLDGNFADGCSFQSDSELLKGAEKLTALHHTLAAKLGPSEFSVGHWQEAPVFRYSALSPEELQAKSVPGVGISWRR